MIDAASNWTMPAIATLWALYPFEELSFTMRIAHYNAY
jgi:hypothetical protein